MWSNSISAVAISKLKLVEKGTFRFFPGNGQANNLLAIISMAKFGHYS